MDSASGAIEDRLVILLSGIASGHIKVWRVNSRAEPLARFETDNGWKLVVFNDVGEWDYLDSAESPDGDRIEYHDGISRIKSVDWNLISSLPVWGKFLNYREYDPEFPEREFDGAE